jgi:hypothetical protein
MRSIWLKRTAGVLALAAAVGGAAWSFDLGPWRSILRL